MFQSHSWDGLENTSSEDVGQLRWGQMSFKKKTQEDFAFLSRYRGKKIDGCFGGDGPWDSLLLTSQRKCWKIQPSAVRKHETACVATPFQLSWLQFSSTWFGEEGSSPKNLAHLAQKTRNPSSLVLTMLLKNKAHVSQKNVLLPTKEAFS